MALASDKCGKKTLHLQAKDTGKHVAKLMTCNELACPRCQPVVSARIKKKIRYFAQHERLVFFNTITTKLDFNDLEKIFGKIRCELSKDFTIEGYMKKKKVSYEKALKWYEKKKEEYVQSDVLVEIEKISRKAAIIELAKKKKVFYNGLTEDEKKIFKDTYKKIIKNDTYTIYENNLKDEKLKEELYDKISQRFKENEFEQFKFIRVIEFQKNGQPHYHFLSNKYVPHTLFKKIITEGVNNVYDNAFILENALEDNKNKEFSSLEEVNTDTVANYVSKITNYVTKDTIEVFNELKKNKSFKKKLISSSDDIKIFDENSDEDELKYKKIGVFDYALNSNNYDIPDVAVSDVEGFIKFNSLAISDDLSQELMKDVNSLVLTDEEKYNYIIAKRLEQIANYDVAAVTKRMEVIEGLSDEQSALIDLFDKNRISLLIGRAGTGKSFTITSLLKALKPNPLTTFVLTYTGKASSRLRELFYANGVGGYKAQTIHKACSSSFNGVFLKNEGNTLNCEYLIIDEVSMIPREILAKLLLAVPSYVKVLFAGDDAQLPPVNDVSIIPELKVNSYIKAVELTKVFRSDDKVLSLAHKILNRQMIDYQVYDENLSRIVNDLVEQGYQILTNTKKMTKEINMIVQKDKTEITRCFNDFKYNLNDRVMIVANSSPREVSNGDTGRIIDFNDKGLTIRLDYEDRDVFYKFEDTEEIVPAYAFTIHKSQGSEYDKVAVILETQKQLNTNNLLYTAVTRAKYDVEVFVPNEDSLVSAIVNSPSSNKATINNVGDFIQRDTMLLV
ncbi:ATP-dependent DNA helicase [Metabacillus fastidiosus]|uniref:ATP-dependent DNA helicase n=1 Tax=Metabacillus fastidiosus TaxID=1458 RepID=UPI003D28FCC6